MLIIEPLCGGRTIAGKILQFEEHTYVKRKRLKLCVWMLLPWSSAWGQTLDDSNLWLEEVTGEEPISFRVPGGSYGWGGIMFVAGDRATASRQIAANARLASEARRDSNPQPSDPY